MSLLDRILGPKVPAAERKARYEKYQVPKVFFTLAAMVLGISILFPYWELELVAPQFPDGLTIEAYVNRLEGDVEELEGLNHYVGMPSFEEGAVLERTVSVAGTLGLVGLLVAGLFIHSRWVLVFVAPTLLFPLFFVADLQWWLWNYGHSLDPRAPLAGAVGTFTPPIFGPGDIAQFETLAYPGPGLVLAVVASVLSAIGLWYHRKAYKPLVDAMRSREEAAGSDEPRPDAAEAEPELAGSEQPARPDPVPAEPATR